MTDSVVSLDAKANSGSIQSEVQTWLDGNTVTSVDDIETTKIGSDRVVVTIAYTA